MSACLPQRIILFTRYPRPGQAKTRLIPALGAEGAAMLQRFMTQRAAAVLRRAARGRGIGLEVRHTGATEQEMRAWLGEAFAYRPQGGGDLGGRMNRVLGGALAEGCPQAVLVGSDLPDLRPEMLTRALDALESRDLVLGPAKDGGYYLVGLSRPAPDLFAGVDWGTDSVLDVTLARAGQAGLSYALLEELGDVDRPGDLPRWRNAPRPVWAPGRISVIIPTLNEAANLERTVRSLAGAGDYEVLATDGGSQDGTPELALAMGLGLLRGAPGRGGQMRRAAREAGGEYLVFLHADTRLAPGWDAEVRRVLNQPGVAAGAFSFRLDQRSASLRLIELMVGLRSRYGRLPYGDQALFIRAETLAGLGGFPDIPLMEDVALIRLARSRGSIAISPLAAVSSARRWREIGVVKNTLLNWRAMALYALGKDPARLAKSYYAANKRPDL